MKRFPLFCVAALLGAAVSAPAQVHVEARLGRHLRGNVSVGQRELHRQAVHCEPAPCAPVSRRSCAPPVHGHWQTVSEQVLVPGCWQEQHVPPTWGWVYSSCGYRHWDIVDRGGCRRVWVPAHYETRTRTVWVSC